jgi:hypothetical protein
VPIKTKNCISLLALLLVLTSAASSQQPSTSKKRVPAMSSDDLPPGEASAGPATSTAADIPAGWNRYLMDGCGLSIALPTEPVTSDLGVPASRSLGIMGKNHTAFGDGFGVVVGHIQSSTEFGVQPFAEGVMKGMSSVPGVSNMKYRVVAGDSPSRVQMNGSMDQRGVALAFEGFAEVRGKNAWSVIAIHELSNTHAGALGGRAIASARFDGPECSDQ